MAALYCVKLLRNTLVVMATQLCIYVILARLLSMKANNKHEVFTCDMHGAIGQVDAITHHP